MLPTYQETQTGSRTAPAVDAAGNPERNSAGKDVGLAVADMHGYTLSVLCPAGQTLAGAGYMRCYVYSASLRQYVRSPQMDVPVTATTRGQTWPDFEMVASLPNLVIFIRDGVTLSGSATDPAETDKLLVRLDGYRRWA